MHGRKIKVLLVTRCHRICILLNIGNQLNAPSESSWPSSHRTSTSPSPCGPGKQGAGSAAPTQHFPGDSTRGKSRGQMRTDAPVRRGWGLPTSRVRAGSSCKKGCPSLPSAGVRSGASCHGLHGHEEEGRWASRTAGEEWPHTTPRRPGAANPGGASPLVVVGGSEEPSRSSPLYGGFVLCNCVTRQFSNYLMSSY